MKFREALQKDIWSKRTSRKLTVGLLVVLIGIVLCYWAEVGWLTRSERKAGSVALTKIDALQDFSDMSAQEFESRDKQANVAVEEAFVAGWTGRDKSVARALSALLTLTELDRGVQSKRAESDKVMTLHGVPNARAVSEQSENTSVALRDGFRSELHGVLH